MAIRLGGIYALERIARDSERDHWPIMEILTAYVREHAPWPPKDIPLLADDLSPTKKSSEGEDQPQLRPAPDIQTILTVIGRRTRIYGKEEDQRLDLARTALQRASLVGAHLERAKLMDAHLERALLVGADLERADLAEADLELAVLREADLEGADLSGATLEDANLVPEQLATVRTLYQAHLDAPLREQIEQRYPHLLKDPEE